MKESLEILTKIFTNSRANSLYKFHTKVGTVRVGWQYIARPVDLGSDMRKRGKTCENLSFRKKSQLRKEGVDGLKALTFIQQTKWFSFLKLEFS